jgi:bifunctional DNA-binding transcriptional regulator/antitoxin component of YhaV-PrlF toxin-antitoxin module
MDEHITASKLAERLLLRPEGATMDDIIGATGGPQYNVLRRLKARGYQVRSAKEGRRTRYFAVAPVAAPMRASISARGQVTLPTAILDAAGLPSPGTVTVSVERDGHIAIRPAPQSLADLRGILPRPKRAVSVEEMEEAIGRAVAADYLRSVRRS